MTIYKDLTDNELLNGLVQDDRLAFTELYLRYSGILLQYAARITRDEDEAGDLIQDVFLRLWEKRQTLLIHSSVRSFLYRTVLNHTLNRMKHLKVAAAYFASAESALEKGTLTSDAALLEKELRQQIESGLDRLPRKMREVFEYSRKQELSYREISEKLNISHATVASHIQHALRILRKGLGMLFSAF